MTQRIRIGLAGVGRMGQIHAASLSARCPTAQLAGVFDADADRGRRVAERFEVPWARSDEVTNNTELVNNTEQESQ